ncbi:MAG: hypothetical protein AB7O73_03080 [Bacteroidia bacterium]
MKQKHYIFLGALIISLLFISTSMDAQCAMCKLSAESSLNKNPGSMARNINSGILYLMAFPYILLAFLFRKQIKALYIRLKNRYTTKKAEI